MSTFLELAQKVARDSGTVSGTLPAAVTGQSGRLLKIVNYTIDAWKQIQNAHDTWAWMRKEFSYSSLTSGTAKYTAASFGITDHAKWVTEKDSLTIYVTATGVSDEGALDFISWSAWRQLYGRGSQDNNRPIHVAVSPSGQLCFGPTPDAAYTVRGEYMQTATILAANGDTPALPARFHDIIAYKGNVLLGEHDEAPTAIATAQRNYNDMLFDLERDQLPPIIIGSEPLA